MKSLYLGTDSMRISGDLVVIRFAAPLTNKTKAHEVRLMKSKKSFAMKYSAST